MFHKRLSDIESVIEIDPNKTNIVWFNEQMLSNTSDTQINLNKT